jgi:predicted RecA/RadA family phage recombinase
MATIVHDGNSIDYTPGSAVTAGQVVVQGELVGVAKVDIPANTLGALAVTGVFDFPKATGGGTAITAGANCYWNAGAQQATTTATGNKLIGKCVRAAADADATVRIRMMQ